MLLTIDAGNTNIVFAIFQGEALRGSWRISTSGTRTGDEYAVWLTHLMALRGLAPAEIERAVIASVVPSATDHLDDLCRRHFEVEPMIVGRGHDLGIEVKLPVPEEVGVDRLVNAVAARELVGAPVIVIDIGTGTTFDVVDASGAYVGGVIAPGPHPSLEALHRLAAKLPRIDIARPRQVIGTGTVSAMQSGFYWGYVGLIGGLIARIHEELGAAAPVVGTGGLVSLFADELPAIRRIEPELTLHGLHHLASRWQEGG